MNRRPFAHTTNPPPYRCTIGRSHAPVCRCCKRAAARRQHGPTSATAPSSVVRHVILLLPSPDTSFQPTVSNILTAS